MGLVGAAGMIKILPILHWGTIVARCRSFRVWAGMLPAAGGPPGQGRRRPVDGRRRPTRSLLPFGAVAGIGEGLLYIDVLSRTSPSSIRAASPCWKGATAVRCAPDRRCSHYSDLIGDPVPSRAGDVRGPRATIPRSTSARYHHRGYLYVALGDNRRYGPCCHEANWSAPSHLSQMRSGVGYKAAYTAKFPFPAKLSSCSADRSDERMWNLCSCG